LRYVHTGAAILSILLFALLRPQFAQQFGNTQETRQSLTRTGTVYVRLIVSTLGGRGLYEKGEYACWLYADRSLVAARQFVTLKRNRVGSPFLETQLSPLELPPGKHTMDVALQLRWRADRDKEFPLVFSDPKTIVVESGKNATVELGNIRDERRDPYLYALPLIKGQNGQTQLSLDYLTKNVNETVQEIESDGTWRAFTLAATAKKQGEYFYLDLSNSRRRGGGREFDEHQISLVADWLRRQWAWFPFPGRGVLRYVPDKQRQRYYHLVEVVDGWIGSFEETESKLLRH